MRKMTITEFLSWAFTQELCKVGASGGTGADYSQAWGMMSEMAALGTLIDRSPNVYGVVPDFIMTTDPHPDAIMAGDAVKALAARGGYEIADGWNPFPEWPDERGLIAAEVKRTVDELRMKRDQLTGKHVVNIVITHAILGRGPDWRADEPKIQMLMRGGKPAWFVSRTAKDAFGKAYSFEVDGLHPRKRQPMAGAYRKYQLSTSIVGAILSRLEWQLWQDALFELYVDLNMQLQTVDLQRPFPDRHPWATIRNSASAS